MGKHQPQMYRKPEREGQIDRYMQELGEEAARRQETIEAQYLKKNLPPQDGSLRAQRLASANLSAQEVVLQEMILLPDEETVRATPRGISGLIRHLRHLPR